jgi:hypothetical protein
MARHDKEFHHFLWVTVGGPKVSVQVVRPDLSRVREPFTELSAPVVIEDFESNDGPIAWKTPEERLSSDGTAALFRTRYAGFILAKPPKVRPCNNLSIYCVFLSLIRF